VLRANEFQVFVCNLNVCLVLCRQRTHIQACINNILRFPEKVKHAEKGKARNMEELPKPTPQMSLFEADPKMKAIQEMLGKIDINTISPVDALLKLNEVLAVLKK